MPATEWSEVFLLSLRGVEHETPEATALAALDADELRTVRRAKAPSRRAESLFGRYATKVLIGLRMRLGPAQVVLCAEPGAKPRAAARDGGAAAPWFNVSHAGGLLAVALSGAGEIGVDVEVPDMRLQADLDAIARRHFSASEADAVARAGGARALAEFVRMWTLKEACLKAVGIGLSARLDSVDVTEPRAAYAVWLDGRRLHAWHRVVPAAGCHLAVARVDGPSEPLLVDLTGQSRPLHHASASVSATS